MDNKMISLKKIFLLIVCLISSSCMNANNKYYDFSSELAIIDEGEFLIKISSTRLVVNSKEVAEIWAAPYYLTLNFQNDKSVVLYGEINNLEVISVDDGNLVFSSEDLIDNARKNNLSHVNDMKYILGFGVELGDVPYIDYIIRFNYKLYSDKNMLFEEGAVSTTVNRDFYEGNRRRGVDIL